MVVDLPYQAAFVAMEQIDGMVDRAAVASLSAFLDPAARMLVRKPIGETMQSQPEAAPSDIGA